MNHIAYINFFRSAAERHAEIAHGRELDGSRRESFFLMNDEEEMQLQLMNDASFPALVLSLYQGKLRAQDRGLVRDHVFGSFDIRINVPEQNDYMAIETARAKAKEIGHHIIALMLSDSEHRCSMFKNIEVNSIRYQFIGPINTGQYGCEFYFTIKGNASTINNIDLNEVFLA